jgi:hypothetical protein
VVVAVVLELTLVLLVVLAVVVVVPTVVRELQVKATEAVTKLVLAEVTTHTPGVLLVAVAQAVKVLTEAMTLADVQVVLELPQPLLALQ